MTQLQDKVIVITGAGRGLGKAAALLFGKEGGRIVAVARTKQELDNTVSEITNAAGEAIAIPTDITDMSQLKELFQKVHHAYGRVDILINNAGIGIFGPLEELTPEALDAMYAVNLKGLVFCSQEAFIRMKQNGGGHIINVVSTAGKTGRANEGAYDATKWAVAGFTESLKAEGKPFGIRVTSFAPGGMNTPFWDTPTGRVHQPSSNKFMDVKYIAELLLHVILLPQSIVVDDILIKRP